MPSPFESLIASAGNQTGPDWLSRYLSQYTDYPHAAPDPAVQGQQQALRGMNMGDLGRSLVGGIAGAGRAVASALPFGSLSQETNNPANAGPVGSDGVPEHLRVPESTSSFVDSGLLQADEAAAALARGLARREAMQQNAPPSPGRVQVSFGGKTYNYSGGQDGGAPLAGGTLGSAFGREWSNQPSDQTHEFAGEGNGSFSQLTELEPSMKTLGRLQQETEHIRARPATQPGAPAGLTQGDVLDIQTRGMIAAQDPKVRAAEAQIRQRAEAAEKLGQLEQYLRGLNRYTEDQIRTSMEAAARDLFLKEGFREGELGAVGSYLKPPANALPLG